MVISGWEMPAFFIGWTIFEGGLTRNCRKEGNSINPAGVKDEMKAWDFVPIP
jgi:hypothetical protein